MSGKAPAGSRTVATHLSKPLSALVERALTNSDNDIAEALARQTALKAGEPASFAGSRRAVTARLKALGLPLAGARLADGSGLDRADKVTAGLLARLLALAAGPDHPELRPVLTGLPVAGFSGTLGDRYEATSCGDGPDQGQDGHPHRGEQPRRDRGRRTGPAARLRLPGLGHHVAGRRGGIARHPGHRAHTGEPVSG